MYRIQKGKPEILLVHPGGPYWRNKDIGTWSIPKGEAKKGEELIDVAKREFEEETGFKPEGDFQYLTDVKGSTKIVSVWKFKGDADASKLKSNIIEIEFPPKSKKKIKVPEVDRGGWFTLEEAKKKLVPYQIGIIKAFEDTHSARIG